MRRGKKQLHLAMTSYYVIDLMTYLREREGEYDIMTMGGDGCD